MIHSVRIVPLDRFNWETVLGIQIQPAQEVYLPSILYSLAQAKFENLFPYGIEFEGRMVGFMMYGSFQGICWINRVVIDEAYQGRRIGTQAMRLLLSYLRTKPGCHEIRTSFAPSNEGAKRFFLNLGFVPITPEWEEEWVAVWTEK